eukprot:1141195-Pelagomonas_calceolata.AAC.1
MADQIKRDQARWSMIGCDEEIARDLNNAHHSCWSGAGGARSCRIKYKLQVTVRFDLQPGTLAARPAQLFQLHKKYP